MKELILYIHSLISGDIHSPLGNLCSGIWNIFSCVNGNPDNHNFGVRLFLGLFFSVFLTIILQLRTKLIYDKKHFIALTGVIFLCFRFITMLIFEWGWQVGLYDDYILHFLSPPLEYFFNTIFFFCVAYYSLHVYDYYPGILKRILFTIPAILITFFVYSTITWKNFFYSSLPSLTNYSDCMVDWQNHLIISIISLYIILVAIFKYKKYNCFLSAFWTLTFISHFERTILSFMGIEISELTTIFFAIEIWTIPLLTLHFINAYVLRNNEIPKERRAALKFQDKSDDDICLDCAQPIKKL